MISKFLLGLTGVDQQLLARTREKTKYERMGGAVLATAVFAALSALFAARTGMHAPWPVAVVVAVLWGLAILNLDSWIVASSKRQPTFLANLLQAVPRLVMAVLLGVVISEPLVLQVFNGEIEAEVEVMQSEQQAEFEEALRTDPRYVVLEQRKSEVGALQAELATGVPRDAVVNDPSVQSAKATLDRVEEALATAERQLACEGTGSCGSGSPGAGPVFQANVQARDRLVEEQERAAAAYEAAQAGALRAAESTAAARAQDLRAQIAVLQEEVRATEEARDRQVAEHDAKVQTSDGLLARIEALHRLSEKEPILALVHKLLFLFLLVIECTPVLLKLTQSLFKPGEYEELARMEEEAGLNAVATRLWQEHLAQQKALELAAVEQQTAVERAALTQQAVLGRQSLEQQAEYERARAAAETCLEADRLRAEAAAQAESAPHVEASLRLWAEQEEARVAAELALVAARERLEAENQASLDASRRQLRAQVDVHDRTMQYWQRQQEALIPQRVGDFLDDGEPAGDPDSAEPVDGGAGVTDGEHPARPVTLIPTQPSRLDLDSDTPAAS